MPRKRRETRTVPIGKLQNDRPVNPLFLEGLIAYFQNPYAYEVRAVVTRKIRIPAGHEPTAEGLAVMRHNFDQTRAHQEHPNTQPIAVLETADGRFWTYDDVHKVVVYHERAPLAMLRVVIIGKDETPIPNA